MPAFSRYIGIDYSGAETPTASLKGLRVYAASDNALPVEVPPPPSPRRYWTRRGIAEWLVERLTEGVPTLVGIDHGFSFPLRYFEAHQLAPDWSAFLDDFPAALADRRRPYLRPVRSRWSARLRAIEEKMTRLARYLDLPNPGFRAVLDWVLGLRKEIGIPHTLAKLSVKEADLDTLVPEAVDDPSTGGNPRQAGAAEMREMFVKAIRGDLT